MNLLGLGEFILHRILDQFTPAELTSFARVSRALAEVCRDPNYWRRRIREEFDFHFPTKYPLLVYHESTQLRQGFPSRKIKKTIRRVVKRGELEVLNRYINLIILGGLGDREAIAAYAAGLSNQLRLIENLERNYNSQIVQVHATDGAVEGGHRELFPGLKVDILSNIDNAARGSQREILEEFLGSNPTRHELNKALGGAASGGQLGLAQELVTRGADDFNNALYWAGIDEQPEIIRWLLETGRIDREKYGFEYALGFARESGDEELVRRLEQI